MHTFHARRETTTTPASPLRHKLDGIRFECPSGLRHASCLTHIHFSNRFAHLYTGTRGRVRCLVGVSCTQYSTHLSTTMYYRQVLWVLVCLHSIVPAIKSGQLQRESVGSPCDMSFSTTFADTLSICIHSHILYYISQFPFTSNSSPEKRTGGKWLSASSSWRPVHESFRLTLTAPSAILPFDSIIVDDDDVMNVAGVTIVPGIRYRWPLLLLKGLFFSNVIFAMGIMGCAPAWMDGTKCVSGAQIQLCLCWSDIYRDSDDETRRVHKGALLCSY